MTFLYVLIDPEEPTHIRYVGFSVDPIARCENHINDALKSQHTHKLRWIYKLLVSGRLPIMLIVSEHETRKEAERAEREAIQRYSEEKHQLTNGTAGGEGLFNPSLETLAKLSAANKRRWADPIQRKALLEAHSSERMSQIAIEAWDSIDRRIEMSITALSRVGTPQWDKFVAARDNPENRVKQRAAVAAANRRRRKP